MKNLNAKHYQLFNCEERLKLTLAAIARDDKEEILLLQRSCPTRHYVGADLAYQNRLQALFIINMQFNNYFRRYSHKLALAKASAAAFSLLCDHNFLLSIYQPKFENIDFPKTTQKLFNIIPQHQSALKSLCMAFVEFCDEIDVDYKNVLELDKYNEDAGDLSQYLHSDAIKEEEFLQQMKAIFLKIWQAYVFE